jgi:hypothetical protein
VPHPCSVCPQFVLKTFSETLLSSALALSFIRNTKLAVKARGATGTQSERQGVSVFRCQTL